MRIAIVISRYYPEIVEGMLQGARKYFKEKDIQIFEKDTFDAPGAFEIPLIAQTLAEQKTYDGIVCLGCVIRGDTAHFDYICQAISQGLMTATLKTGVPIAFGILTAYKEEQCIERSKDDSHNKGREAARACVEAAVTLRRIGVSNP